MRNALGRLFGTIGLLAALSVWAGCDREIMEAETPTGQEIEVEEEFGTGDLEAEVED